MALNRSMGMRRARAALARFPRLYLLVRYLRTTPKARRFLVNRHTDLVIEGFPRSANGWAVRVFNRWQREDGRGRVIVANHDHHEAQVVAGCRRGLPVLVIVRDPVDAIRSFCLRDPDIDHVWALHRWLRYYAMVERHADRLVVATFAQVTQDLGSVIERVNQRFGCNFAFGETDETLYRRITERMRPSSFPEVARRAQLAAVKLDFPASDLARAHALLARMTALAGRQPINDHEREEQA